MKKLSIILVLIVSGCSEINNEIHSRYISVFTDDNGCQYLINSYNGGITPRLGPDGKQMCEGYVYGNQLD